MEYTHSGYVTLFTITAFQPFERYEFDLENENIKGHCVVYFPKGMGKPKSYSQKPFSPRNGI